MALSQANKRCTPAEYYALERDAAYESDYYNGETFDVFGGTATAHSPITANIVGSLWNLLRGNS